MCLNRSLGDSKWSKDILVEPISLLKEGDGCRL